MAEPMPPGWEKRQCARTNRPYFVDHNSGLTTWDDPRTKENIPLPEGWEKRQDKKTGRFYFVDHSNERTTWDDPRGSLIADTEEDDPLPPGWERRHTTSGAAYYVDHSTRNTQWERPQVSANARADPSPSFESGFDEESSQVSSSERTPPRPDVELPPNWEIKYDSKNERWFYLDHDNKTTTWEPPFLQPRELLEPPVSSMASARPARIPAAAPAPRDHKPSLDEGMANLEVAEQEAEPPDAICCPITQEIMVEPVLLVGDGHTYERAAITTWLRDHNTSPLTNAVLPDLTLVANHAVKKMTAEWYER